jgi:hypothetical protein
MVAGQAVAATPGVFFGQIEASKPASSISSIGYRQKTALSHARRGKKPCFRPKKPLFSPQNATFRKAFFRRSPEPLSSSIRTVAINI